MDLPKAPKKKRPLGGRRCYHYSRLRTVALLSALVWAATATALAGAALLSWPETPEPVPPLVRIERAARALYEDDCAVRVSTVQYEDREQLAAMNQDAVLYLAERGDLGHFITVGKRRGLPQYLGVAVWCTPLENIIRRA